MGAATLLFLEAPSLGALAGDALRRSTNTSSGDAIKR
jgi:hypothetical protein